MVVRGSKERRSPKVEPTWEIEKMSQVCGVCLLPTVLRYWSSGAVWCYALIALKAILEYQVFWAFQFALLWRLGDLWFSFCIWGILARALSRSCTWRCAGRESERYWQGRPPYRSRNVNVSGRILSNSMPKLGVWLLTLERKRWLKYNPSFWKIIVYRNIVHLSSLMSSA